jgi:hypothetical protein
MFGLHLVSLAVGVVVAQFLPVTVASFIKAKVVALKAKAAPAASAAVAAVEAEVKKVV